MGSRWRIGNGNKVGIWKDGWIPNNNDSLVHGPRVHLEENALVSELIDTNSKKWRKYVVLSCFHPHEAKKILSLPLSHRLPHDKIIWCCEKNGEYSVRSAYHL
ncbi:F-box protein, partial [Trifolium medium]|nr:F-box protein [Trifolium medium]